MIINCTWFAAKESKCECAKGHWRDNGGRKRRGGGVLMDCGEDIIAA